MSSSDFTQRITEGLTPEERREFFLSLCDEQNCDGKRHECWNCGGEGFVEPEDWQDDEETPCPICGGSGGWNCSLAKEEEESHGA